MNVLYIFKLLTTFITTNNNNKRDMAGLDYFYTMGIFVLILSLGCTCNKAPTQQKQLPTKKHTTNTTPISTMPKVSKDKKLLKLAEQKFMGFMGLKKRPSKYTRHNVKVPDHLWKLYYKWSDDAYQDRDKENADTARLFYHNDTIQIPVKNDLLFNVTAIPRGEKVHRAELLLFNERRRTIKRKKLIHLYRSYVHNTSLVLAYMKRVRNNQKGYVKIDVTDLITDWLNNGVENSSILIDVDRNDNQDNSVHIRKRRWITTEEWDEKRPLLVVYTQNNRPSSRKKVRQTAAKSRKRRNYIPYEYNERLLYELNETHQRVRSKTCRLQPFRLDFKDCGWDEWIIAPDGYYINFCRGKCPQPLSPHYNTTNHAVIQNALLSIHRHINIPQLCCIPTSFKDQTFLYLDNTGNLLLKTPTEMVALGCGCR